MKKKRMHVMSLSCGFPCGGCLLSEDEIENRLHIGLRIKFHCINFLNVCLASFMYDELFMMK